VNDASGGAGVPARFREFLKFKVVPRCQLPSGRPHLSVRSTRHKPRPGRKPRQSRPTQPQAREAGETTCTRNSHAFAEPAASAPHSGHATLLPRPANEYPHFLQGRTLPRDQYTARDLHAHTDHQITNAPNIHVGNLIAGSWVPPPKLTCGHHPQGVFATAIGCICDTFGQITHCPGLIGKFPGYHPIPTCPIPNPYTTGPIIPGELLQPPSLNATASTTNITTTIGASQRPENRKTSRSTRPPHSPRITPIIPRTRVKLTFSPAIALLSITPDSICASTSFSPLRRHTRAVTVSWSTTQYSRTPNAS
jgi:hypothetical protein